MAEGDRALNRRQALSLLAASPLAMPRAWAQTRPTAQCRVILGVGHGLLLEPDGTLQTWLRQEGDLTNGRAPDWLGLGPDTPFSTFTLAAVRGLTNVVKAAVGSRCTFAVLADGRLLSWGSNAGFGLLGTTSLSTVEVSASWGPNSNVPVAPATKFDAIDVSAQGEHVLALARDGSVYAWGDGRRGQLGIGPLPVINFKTHTPDRMTYVPFPVRVPDLTGVVAISAGPAHSLALLRDGTVRGWGFNNAGQVGDGTTIDRDAPVPVQGVRNVVAIAAGGVFGLALLADGTVMAWGEEGTGGLSPVPALVPGAHAIKAIAAGGRHAAGVTDQGTVVTWGEDTFHQLGRGWPARPPAPGAAAVPGLTGVQSIAADLAATTTAVLTSGRIMTWGGVREWTRPDGAAGLSPHPILLWIDGLDQS
jgi:alpha-tubulin suppressor-like RCC1 family protein